MHVRSHEKLIVWKEAYALCLAIYQSTRTFPKDEKYGLVSQMRRAGYSVPTNIAEGNTRRTSADKKRFLDIASGSLEEVHVFLLLSHDLEYITDFSFSTFENALRRVSYLITKLHGSL